MGGKAAGVSPSKEGRFPILPDPPPAPGTPRRRSPEIPIREILAWAVRSKVALTIVAGIGFRLACCVSRRGFWMDEVALAGNIQRLTPLEFCGPLVMNQLAPPGFLVAAWCSFRLLGQYEFALRLIPLAGGIGSLFLFVGVARRCLSARAVFPALVMFVASNDLIYYSSEFKQYSTDVTATLGCLLIGLMVGSRPLTVGGSAGLAAFGASVVWFSHPSIFALTSVGSVGLIRALVARDWRSIGLWLVVGMAWLGSFAGVHAVASRQLAGSDQMWRFWGFAFPPMPPKSIWDAIWLLRRLAYYFINPLNFDAPFGPRLSMLPALALAMVGVSRLARLDPYRLALLALPVAATLAASAFRLYPFHGRLVLFLAPIPLIAIAAGLEAVRENRGRDLIYYILMALVVAFPAAYAVEQVFDQSWIHNYLGDLHPANIDPDQFPF